MPRRMAMMWRWSMAYPCPRGLEAGEGGVGGVDDVRTLRADGLASARLVEAAEADGADERDRRRRPIQSRLAADLGADEEAGG